MCGIFGFIGRRSRAESIDLGTALRSLHHRGPDDNGTYFGVSQSDPDIACTLAHTRLSIIDLSSAGHQPMSTKDGRYTIVYNGEIYNFREIRVELEALGDRFSSDSDTEVVLLSYARWGERCLQRFRGMFAFAVWDAASGTLFAARDRLGIKPLYVIESDDSVVVASELRALLNTGLARRTLSAEGVLSYLRFGSTQEPSTLIDGVAMLRAGHWLRRSAGACERQPYWSFPTETSDVTTTAEAGEIVRPFLREAVQMHLVSDVPLGVFLSGGIDSTVVAGLASGGQRRPIHTFTVTFDENEYDEAAFAAAVAARCGSDHHQVRLSSESLATEIDDVCRKYDQPSADGLNTYFIAKAARAEGLTVALSGQGGDELFAGYRSFRNAHRLHILRSITSLIPSSVRKGVMNAVAPKLTTAKQQRLEALALESMTAAESHAHVRCMFSEREIDGLMNGIDTSRGQGQSLSANALPLQGDDVNAWSVLELAGYLRNTLLRDTDSLSMCHGLEIRVPFLDHVLVEAVLRLPGRLKISRDRNKPLLLSAAGDVPESVWRRKKMGFVLPLEKWFRGSMRGWAEDTLFSGGEYLDQREIKKIWAEFLVGSVSGRAWRLWCLLSLIRWCQENRVGWASSLMLDDYLALSV